MTESPDEVDAGSTRGELEQTGLTVTNLVATLDLDREIDLEALADDVDQSEYHPETSPFLVYRPVADESPTVLVPSNGQISVVGAKTKQELYDATSVFLSELTELGIEVTADPEDLVIRNVVVNGDLGVDLDLNVLSIALGLESVEYEPEQFPGMIYRGGKNATVLVFRSGKIVITGVDSYSEAIEAKEEFLSHLDTLDSNLDLD